MECCGFYIARTGVNVLWDVAVQYIARTGVNVLWNVAVQYIARTVVTVLWNARYCTLQGPVLVFCGILR